MGWPRRFQQRPPLRPFLGMTAVVFVVASVSGIVLSSRTPTLRDREAGSPRYGAGPPASSSSSGPAPTASGTAFVHLARSSSASAIPAVPDCAAGDLVLGAATDRDRYRPGERVNLTFTWRNVSTHSCYQPNHVSGFWILNSRDDVVYRFRTPLLCAQHSPCAPPIQPGETRSDVNWAWDQHVEVKGSNQEAPRGRYRVEGFFRNAGSALSVPFDLVADQAAPTVTLPPR